VRVSSRSRSPVTDAAAIVPPMICAVNGSRLGAPSASAPLATTGSTAVTVPAATASSSTGNVPRPSPTRRTEVHAATPSITSR
jgi:hypothetical protein